MVNTERLGLKQELIMHLWSGTGDVDRKAEEMLPWLLDRLTDAYQRGATDGGKAVLAKLREFIDQAGL